MHKFFAAMVLSISIWPGAYADSIKVHIQTQSDLGSVRAVLHTTPEKKMVAKQVTPAKLGISEIIFEDIPAGVYGIALYHDQNNNQTLDRGLFGIPKEPFGFSNNPQIRFSPPKFDDYKFEFVGIPMQLEIQLNSY